jgi:hypothetical protein
VKQAAHEAHVACTMQFILGAHLAAVDEMHLADLL